jgi:hypothetical protein
MAGYGLAAQSHHAAFFLESACFDSLTRFESNRFAFFNSASRAMLSPRPPRLMKYVSILMPDPGPFGDTFFDAKLLAMVAASFVNSPSGGCVESVFT